VTEVINVPTLEDHQEVNGKDTDCSDSDVCDSNDSVHGDFAAQVRATLAQLPKSNDSDHGDFDAQFRATLAQLPESERRELCSNLLQQITLMQVLNTPPEGELFV
jgi:hypothetical protein